MDFNNYYKKSEKNPDLIDGWKYADDGDDNWKHDGRFADDSKKMILNMKRQNILRENDAARAMLEKVMMDTEIKLRSGAVITGYGDEDVPDEADMNVMEKMESDALQRTAGAKVQKQPIISNILSDAIGLGVEVEQAERNGYQKPLGGYVSEYLVKFVDETGKPFENVREVMKSFGFRNVEMLKEKQVNDFLFDYTNWFLSRSRYILNTLVSLPEYSKFSGIKYSLLVSKVLRQIEADKERPDIIRYGKVESREKFIIVEICGVKFIMIKPEELDAWQEYLAKIGAMERKIVGDTESVKFLAKVYNGVGGKEDLERDTVYEWISFSLEAWPGMEYDLEKHRSSFRLRLNFADAYKYYTDIFGDESVTYRVFCMRLGQLGFKKYAMEGKRGFYYFLKEIPGKTTGESDNAKEIRDSIAKWEKENGNGVVKIDIVKTNVKKEEVKLQSVLEYERINSELR